MATHYSILAWRIPWTEEPGGLQFIHTHTHTHTHIHTHREQGIIYKMLVMVIFLWWNE